MFTAPSSVPSNTRCGAAAATQSGWHTRRTWRRYAHALLRYFARTARYRLTLSEKGDAIAYVNHKTHEVFVNTAFPETPGALKRPRHPSQREKRTAELLKKPTVLWLRALIGHEAGHILHSGAKPQGLLGWLWNALEDERMERLQAALYPGLGEDFDAAGDVMYAHACKETPPQGTAEGLLRACLAWRWAHDQPNNGHATNQEHHEHLVGTMGVGPVEWAPVEALVEQAWTVATSDEVTQIARELLDLLGLDPNQEVPEGLPAIGDLAEGLPGRPGSKIGASGKSSGGSTLGDRQGGEACAPDAPSVDPASEEARRAEVLLQGLTGGVRRLAQALRPPQDHTARTAHRSRGRYEYRRHAAGHERVFGRRPEEPKPPAFITCVLDLSGSMTQQGPDGKNLLEHAQRTVLLVSAAAEAAGVTLCVVPFRDAPLPVLESAALGHERLRASVASLHPVGGTQLAPALRSALEGTSEGRAHQHGGAHIVLIITDGHLDRNDAHVTRAIHERARRAASCANRLVALPLLVGPAATGDAEAARAAYEEAFGRVCPLADAAELPDRAERWLRAALTR